MAPKPQIELSQRSVTAFYIPSLSENRVPQQFAASSSYFEMAMMVMSHVRTHPAMGFPDVFHNSQALQKSRRPTSSALLATDWCHKSPLQAPIYWRYLYRPIGKAYIRRFAQKLWLYMVQSLNFGVLKFTKKNGHTIFQNHPQHFFLDTR